MAEHLLKALRRLHDCAESDRLDCLIACAITMRHLLTMISSRSFSKWFKICRKIRKIRESTDKQVNQREVIGEIHFQLQLAHFNEDKVGSQHRVSFLLGERHRLRIVQRQASQGCHVVQNFQQQVHADFAVDV